MTRLDCECVDVKACLAAPARRFIFGHGLFRVLLVVRFCSVRYVTAATESASYSRHSTDRLAAKRRSPVPWVYVIVYPVFIRWRYRRTTLYRTVQQLCDYGILSHRHIPHRRCYHFPPRATGPSRPSSIPLVTHPCLRPHSHSSS